MLLPVSAAPRVRGVLLSALVVVLVAAGTTALVAARATGSEDRCASFAAARQARAGDDVGTGRRIAVIGDSYAVGLGLDDPARSWPSRLPGRVHVDGFSGSGFTAGASTCGRVSYADRASAVAATDPDLVVVEGGLNDVDQAHADVADGFRQLLAALDGLDVVVVGPAAAPSRVTMIDGVDMQLAALCRQAGVPYLRTSGLDLTYLDDALHLTPEGHVAFGDAVAAGLADLPR